MKKLSLSIILVLMASVASADIGLFFDNTRQFGNTGIIQAEFPNIPLVACPTFKRCANRTANHSVLFSVYTDAKKMRAEIKATGDKVALKGPVAKTTGAGFTVSLHDGMGYSGYYAVIGIKMKGNPTAKIASDKRIAIALAIRDMMAKAYSRLDSGEVPMGNADFTDQDLTQMKIQRKYPQASGFSTSYFNNDGFWDYLYAHDENNNFIGTFDKKGNFLSPLQLVPPNLVSTFIASGNILNIYPTAFYYYEVITDVKSYYQVHDQCNKFLGVYESTTNSVSTTPVAATRPPIC